MLLLDPSIYYCLQSQRIDIWAFSLKNSPPNADKVLNDEETRTAQRFLFPRHQRRYAVSHAVLRVLLGRYLNLNPKSIKFEKGKHGKPFVEDASQLEFNLTHTQDLAILAIGQTFPLGIDAEFFSPRSYEGIARSLYSPQEIDSFLQLPKTIQQLSFFHIWSQKEALIKACGLGLSYPTQTFSVPILPPSDALVFDSVEQREWRILSFMPQLGCSAALCHHPDVQKISYNLINPTNLFKE